LALAEVQLADQLGEALALNGVLVVVVALDDLLLMGRKVFQRHRPSPLRGLPSHASLVVAWWNHRIASRAASRRRRRFLRVRGAHGGLSRLQSCPTVRVALGPRPAGAGMRVVVQRVRRARVTVGDEVVGEIGPGLLVLLGVTHSDTIDNARWL